MTSPEIRREQFLDKSLPSSEESERVILGSILIDNRVMAEAAESLQAGEFYSPLNRRVFTAMATLFAAGKNIDPIIIGEELKKEGSLESMGGISSITNLSFGMPHFTKVAEYIAIVKQKARLRDLIRTCASITGEALAEEDDAESILDRAEQQIFAVCSTSERTQTEKVGPLVKENLAKTELLMKTGEHVVGVPSGLDRLDNMTGGWRKGSLTILAGRPSMGKSAAALQFAEYGSENGRVVAYFSLEDTSEQVTNRLICQRARIDLKLYGQAKLTHVMFHNASESYRHLQDRKLYIVDAPRLTPMQMFAKARRIFAENGRLDLIVVDYLQMMDGSKKTESRLQEVSHISRELKAVARELDVPVIALSQLSRKCEERNPPKPIMSDLRESGSIEQDADTVMFVYRSEYYKQTPDNAGIGEFIIAKQRNGPTGDVKVAFLKEYVRFENLFNDSPLQERLN